ncbi:MAG: hypothetical protein EBR09_10840 [Proteobacteria bacterium]|nr:hypothetical protein [Pseudomonadota bacterium]
MQSLFHPVFLSLMLISCGSSQFQTTVKTRGSSQKTASAEALGKDSPNASPEGVAGEKSAEFKFGPKSTPNDVLFIFDNSSSMKQHLEMVKKGFESLSSADWFGDVKIGVMTTLPAESANLSQTHSGVNVYKGINSEPGFLSLVSAKAFAEYKKVADSSKSSAYAEPLCDEEWFSPEAVNSNRKRCLSVALQNPHHGVGCEAGMTALSQITAKMASRGSKLFRKSALAQVVFVSDAQDPGCGNSELQKTRPSAGSLREQVLKQNDLIDLKFHGVLPVEGGMETSETSGNKDFGFPYNTLIKSNKGILLDITASTDYSSFAKSIAKSALPEPVFSFGAKISKVLEVKVDGKILPASDFKLAADGKSVRIEGLNPSADVKVQIGYLP